ncbi:MAG: J domain-containing protein [Smithella sp.]|jgi:hypothetical protein|nr:J domain-containing protein [Smithella sp.]
MLAKIKPSQQKPPLRYCLSCGKTDNMRNRRYCSLKCRQHLRQKLTTRTGLLEALNVRHATFYFTPEMIVLDIIVRDIREVFRYRALRTNGSRPADDFGKMANSLGEAWWEETARTGKKYMASRRLLQMAEKHEGESLSLVRPRLIRTPAVRAESLRCLGISKAELGSKQLGRLIRDAYRRQAKIHHPDAGGQPTTFRNIHDAYKDLLKWADNPTFIRRRGFPDKWYYDGTAQKWTQPTPRKR